jgi:hypothetical protein
MRTLEREYEVTLFERMRSDGRCCGVGLSKDFFHGRADMMRPVVIVLGSRTVGFTIKKDIVALVQKKTYVDHYLSYVGLARSPLADR